MPNATYTFDELSAGTSYPVVTESDANFKVNLFNATGGIVPLNGGGGDIWVRAGAGFTPGAELFLQIDADHVTTSAAITSFNDQSGNGRDIPYVSGTKSSISTGKFNGKDGIAFFGGNYTYTHNDSFSGVECFASFIPPGTSTVYGTTALNMQPQSSGTGLVNSTASVSGYRIALINLDSSFLDGSRGVNHQLGHYRDGDTANLADTNDAQTFPYTNAYTSIGSDNATASLNNGFIRKLYLCSANVNGTNRHNYEGLLAWDIPFEHYRLPIGHPYRDVNSNGIITVAATPTIIGVVVGDATAIITHLPMDEGNSTPTYTSTSSVGAVAASATGPTVTVTGLTNASSQTFTTVASNVAGPSSASSASFAATPTSGSTHLTGLVAEFQFTEPNNYWIAFDASGNNHNVGQFGNPGTTTATNHNVRTLDGSTQTFESIETALTTSLVSGDCTIMVHFYCTDFSNYGTLVCLRNSGADIDFMLRVAQTSGDLVLFGPGAENLTIKSGLTSAAYHKAIVTINHSTKEWRYKVDSDAVGTHTMASNMAGGKPYGMGGLQRLGVSELLKGRLSLVTLWNVHKSDTELANELSYWTP